jgi:hypothetical protein
MEAAHRREIVTPMGWIAKTSAKLSLSLHRTDSRAKKTEVYARPTSSLRR